MNICKRFIKVVLFVICVPIWILWSVIWVLVLAVIMFTAAPITYIITGKDLIMLWGDKLDLIFHLVYKIEQKIDEL